VKAFRSDRNAREVIVMPSVKVYRPPLSFWPVVLHVALLALFLGPVVGSLAATSSVPEPPPIWVTLLLGTIAVLGTSAFGFFLVIYPTMRYEFRDDALHLICGPVHAKIAYADITKVSKADLPFDPSSSGWRWPGYALFNVVYGKRGWIWMCSTRFMKRVTLIETKGGKYFGVSPRESDEAAFVAEIEKRVKAA
jgi:hypothetical protein